MSGMLLSNIKVLGSTGILHRSHRSMAGGTKQLRDNHNRIHDYMRISITDKCNLRCRYCMPEHGIELIDRENYLKLDELKRLADIFVTRCGVSKIRLTGGEPTISKNCMPFLNYLNGLRVGGLKEIAMTTNGLTLKRDAARMRKCGLNAINVSLDTLREDRYELMTRRRGWKLALDGIESALATGFDQLKINCVIMKGYNDDELGDFLNLAMKWPVEVRFIEFMPFEGNKWTSELLVSSKHLLALVTEIIPDLVQVPQGKHATSRVYSSPSMLGSIGFISSMSDDFCSGCNRLRLTADGQLKVCLFGKEETSLRDLMRNGATDGEVVKAIETSLHRKAFKHAGSEILQQTTARPMIRIDGNIAMVNIGEKSHSKRVAIACGRILVGQEVLCLINNKAIAKGNVISLSKIAGIMGAKLTSQLIPLCHSIPLDYVRVGIEQCEHSESLIVTASVQAHHNTGVEMESLTAVSVALLSIYDMCKSVNKSMIISDIKLLSKKKS